LFQKASTRFGQPSADEGQTQDALGEVNTHNIPDIPPSCPEILASFWPGSLLLSPFRREADTLF